jgi:hypothetical protein
MIKKLVLKIAKKSAVRKKIKRLVSQDVKKNAARLKLKKVTLLLKYQEMSKYTFVMQTVLLILTLAQTILTKVTDTEVTNLLLSTYTYKSPADILSVGLFLWMIH